jgi:MFS family permease
MSASVTERHAPRGRGGLLRHHDFALLWVGETTSTVGSMVSIVAMPMVAIDVLHTGTFIVGALTALAQLPWLVIGLFVGAWVDRFPRRRLMLICDVASALVFLSVPIAAWLGVLTVAQLLLAGLVAGVCDVFFMTSYQAYLPSLLDRSDLIEGNAKLQGSTSAALLVGPNLAGLLATAFGVVTGVLANSASFIVSAACLLRIRAREAPIERRAGKRSIRAEIGEGMRFVATDSFLRSFSLLGGALNLTVSGIQALLVPFLILTLHINTGWTGVLMASGGVGGICGALTARRVAARIGSARALLIWVACGMPFALLVPLADRGPRIALFVVGLAFANAGMVASNVITSSFRQTYAPREMLGRVSTSMRFFYYGLIPAGAIVGGSLGAWIGPRDALWIFVCCLVLSTLILLDSPILHYRDLPTTPADRLDAVTQPATSN